MTGDKTITVIIGGMYGGKTVEMSKTMSIKTHMQVCYALQEIPTNPGKSIFLAGPTPPYMGTPSWRHEAIRTLRDLGFNGTVFVPEYENAIRHGTYDHQVQWEHDALHIANVIVFWIPRTDELPDLTTNDEWGYWKTSGKVVLGIPTESQSKCQYQMWYAGKLGVPFADNLETTIKHALTMLKEKGL